MKLGRPGKETAVVLLLAAFVGSVCLFGCPTDAQAGRSFDGSSDVLEANEAVYGASGSGLTSVFTVTAQAQRTGAGNSPMIFTLGSSSVSAPGWMAHVNHSSDVYRTNRSFDGAWHDAVGTTTVSVGDWHSFASTEDDSAGVEIFVDGASDGSNSDTDWPGTLNPTYINRTTVGAYRASALYNRFVGVIGPITTWDVILSGDEILAIAKGAHWSTIRPDQVSHHWSMCAGTGAQDEPDVVGGVHLTTGSAGRAGHLPLGPMPGAQQ